MARYSANFLPFCVKAICPLRSTLTCPSRVMRFSAAVTAGGVTCNSSASRALIGVCFSSCISQMAFR